MEEKRIIRCKASPFRRANSVLIPHAKTRCWVYSATSFRIFVIWFVNSRPCLLLRGKLLGNAAAHYVDIPREGLRGELDALAERWEDLHYLDDVVHR